MVRPICWTLIIFKTVFQLPRPSLLFRQKQNQVKFKTSKSRTRIFYSKSRRLVFSAKDFFLLYFFFNAFFAKAFLSHCLWVLSGATIAIFPELFILWRWGGDPAKKLSHVEREKRDERGGSRDRRKKIKRLSKKQNEDTNYEKKEVTSKKTKTEKLTKRKKRIKRRE